MKRITFPVKNIKSFFFVGVLCAFFIGATQAQGSWTTGGPPGANVNSLAMAETDPDIIYVGTESGVYKTVDGGNTWAKTGFAEMRVSVVQVAPDNRDIVYAGTDDGIYKSNDGGSTWTQKGLSGARVNAIAIDPVNPQILYAGTGVSDWDFDGSSTDGIFKSTNGGDNWDLKCSVGFDLVYSLLIDTSHSLYVYAGVYGNSDNGFLKSIDRGETWQERDVGRFGPWDKVVALAMTSAGSSLATIYAVVGGGDVYKSANRGETWESTGTPFIPTLSPWSVAVDPNDPSVIYAGAGQYYQGPLYKSTDGADTWSIKTNGLPTGPSSIVIDPRNSDVYVGLPEGGVYKSTDKAESWNISSLSTAPVEALAVHPTSSDIVFAAIQGSGYCLAKTTNRGTSWDYLVDSPTNLGAVAVDPQNPSTIFVGEGTEYQRDVYIYKSTDGGQSWTGTALFHLYDTIELGVSDIWIDPSDSSTILVAVRGETDFVGQHGGGVYRSTDGGATWGRSPVWLTIQSVTTLASDPKDPQILYYGTSAWGYVYKSTSGGSGWTRISPGGESWWRVRDIEVDLNSYVYAATSEGLMKWDGSDWTELPGLSEYSIQAIAIDRNASPETIYAGTGEDGVFVSEDGGNTWTSFNEGLGNLSITTLTLSNSLPKVLYAGTEYGGVWSEVLDSGNATVSGSLTLPSEASGKEYFVIIDSDTDGDNGYVNDTIGTCGSGTTVDYSISNVPAGTYYVYACVRVVSAHDSPPQSGDYFGFYGTGSTEPSEANAVVPPSGTVIFDITLSIMGEPLPDSDGDGVPDKEEQGPDGTDTTYDGNNDNIPDSQQDNVASGHTYDGQNYVTLAVPDPATISDAEAVDNPSSADSPSGVEFTYGFFTFTVNNVGAGGTATATLYLPAGATPDTYYKYGPTPTNQTDHWYEFLYDGETGAEINNNVITLHFVDGKRGDDDLDDTNGIIVDQGGPGFTAAPTPTPAGGGGGGGGGGCFISVM